MQNPLILTGDDPAAVTVAQLHRDLLGLGWTEGTSASPDRWSSDRRSTGQCAVTALIVQDALGGDLLRTVNEGDSHYWNRLPDGREVDLTRDQFDTWAPSEDVVVRDRDYVVSHPATTERYLRLRTRLPFA